MILITHFGGPDNIIFRKFPIEFCIVVYCVSNNDDLFLAGMLLYYKPGGTHVLPMDDCLCSF